MPDQTSAPPPATPPQPPAPPATPAGPTINIGEEYGTAKKNLPPTRIVLIAIGIVAVVVVIASFVKRAKPQGSGSLDNVVAVEIPGQTSTMVALTFTLHNGSDKALYVRSLQGKVTTAAAKRPQMQSLPWISIVTSRPSLPLKAVPSCHFHLKSGSKSDRQSIAPSSLRFP